MSYKHLSLSLGRHEATIGREIESATEPVFRTLHEVFEELTEER